MPFDYNAARNAGYSDDEIASFLGNERKFDVAGARKSGYSSQEIIKHLQETEDTRSAPEKFLAGVRHAGSRAVKGVGELLTKGAASAAGPLGFAVRGAANALVPQSFQEALSPEQLEYMKQAANTPDGTAGEIATNVALTAVPGTHAYRAASGCPAFLPENFGRSG